MPDVKVIGFECVLYRKVGATWVEVEQIKNATLNIGFAEGEATTRGSNGVEEMEPTLMQISIEGALLWLNDNVECLLLFDACFDRSEIELMALTGANTNPNAKGVTGKFKLSKFPRKEDLDKLVEHDITFKPCRGSGIVKATGVAP